MSNETKYIFCVHSIEENEGDPVTEQEYIGLNIITFCPLDYWTERQCLPDYYFLDQLKNCLTDGYNEYICVEESQWCSKKSKDRIIFDLENIGFIHSPELELFISWCKQ